MVNIQSIHPTMVNRKNLIQFLSDLLYQAIKVDHSPPPNNHPDYFNQCSKKYYRG